MCLQDNDLSEFDESRDIIDSLVDEYKACESPDYIKWGMEVNFIFFKLPDYFFSILLPILNSPPILEFVQDPNHLLTGEGNTAGIVDPKLAS